MSPLLKNSLDWISRQNEENEAPLTAFFGNVAALGAVSPGGIGGLRGPVPLRMMLGNISVTVVPSQTAVGSGFLAFDENEQLKDDNQTAMLKATIDEFVKVASRMSE